jgi:glutamyl-tRNA reductase
VSVLVVGLSHKTASVATLERAAVSGDALGKLMQDVTYLPDVAETFVISTCNRVEVYADVDRFHGAVTGICDLLARYSGIPAADLTPSLYVHYEDRAVQHLLSVASGLESMVVGEDQILGQVRSALRVAREHGTNGRVLGDLGRAALRAGKRSRAETEIDRLGVSLVSVGLDIALAGLRASRENLADDNRSDLSGLDVLVVGAGSMSGLTVATVARGGARRVIVANRTRVHAERLAAGVAALTAAEVVDLADIESAMARADLVVSCTGATGVVVSAETVSAALRKPRRGPLVLLDLAMPRDVDPAVAHLPGARVFDMEAISRSDSVMAHTADSVRAVRDIVDQEFAAYLSARHAARVAPTVVALRAKAAEVVDAELERLASRVSSEGLTGHALEEIAQTVHRVVDKLLHAPTVRVKELAGGPGGEDYAAALRVLFDLDPRAVDAVAAATPAATPAIPDLEG